MNTARIALFVLVVLLTTASSAIAEAVALDVWMTTGTGRDGPNDSLFRNNALESVLNGGSTVGTLGEPGSVEPITEMTGRHFIRTPNELTYLGEAGDAWGNEWSALFNVRGDGSTQFKLHDLHWGVDSDDPNDWFDGGGDFGGFGYTDTFIGIDWGGDGARGGGDDTVYTSGNGDTLVDEMAGLILRNSLAISSSGGSLTDRYNATLSDINGVTPFDINVTFEQADQFGITIPGGIGSASVNVTSTDLVTSSEIGDGTSPVVPEPGTASMLLVGAGVALVATGRRRRPRA